MPWDTAMKAKEAAGEGPPIEKVPVLVQTGRWFALWRSGLEDACLSPYTSLCPPPHRWHSLPGLVEEKWHLLDMPPLSWSPPSPSPPPIPFLKILENKALLHLFWSYKTPYTPFSSNYFNECRFTIDTLETTNRVHLYSHYTEITLPASIWQAKPIRRLLLPQFCMNCCHLTLYPSGSSYYSSVSSSLEAV